MINNRLMDFDSNFCIITIINIFFFSDQGRVFKIVQWYTEEGSTESVLLDIFEVTPGEPVRVMEISSKVTFFFTFMITCIFSNILIFLFTCKILTSLC